MNKNLNDQRLIFLELVHLGLCSGKVWENRFFLYCMTLVDPYSKLLLNNVLHVFSLKLASFLRYYVCEKTHLSEGIL